MEKYAFFEQSLNKLREENQFCSLKHITPLDGAYVLFQDRKMLNFCSNDYLGLSQHQDLKKNAIRFLLQHGLGPTTSCVVNTHLECHRMVEEKLSQLIGTESAHLFNSRFQVNMTVLATLATPKSQLFIDRGCHNGLLHGAAFSQAQIKTYEHLDLIELEQLLERAKDAPAFSKVIVTESLFSLEGDIADLNTLIEIANHYQAILYVDDSHAMGVLGHQGMGLAAHKSGIDIIVGTFSKACGSVGAYLGCNHLVKEYLINACPGLRDASLPPSILGAIDAALDLIPQMEGERKQLEQRAYWLRKQFQDLGFSTGNSTSHLIPLYTGNEEDTQVFLKGLYEAEILTTPILCPLVPENTSRLRFAINSCHSPDHLNHVASAIQSFGTGLCKGDAIIDRGAAKIISKKLEPGKLLEQSALQ